MNGCPRTLANPGAAPLINFDSKVIYDPTDGRWIISALGGTAAQLSAGTHMPFVYLAISTSSDPTSTWRLYWYQGCGNYTNNSAYIGDQPKLGLSDKWLVAQNSACGPGPLYNLAVFDKSAMYAGPATLYTNVNWFPLFNPQELSVPAFTVPTPSPAGYEYLLSSDISLSGNPAMVFSYIFGGTDQPQLYVGQIYVVYTYITDAVTELPELATPKCTDCSKSCRCIGSGADDRMQSATIQLLQNGDYALISTWAFGLQQNSQSPLGMGLTYILFDLDQQAIVESSEGNSSGGSYLYPSVAMVNDKTNGDQGVWQLDTSGPYANEYPASVEWVMDFDNGGLTSLSKSGAAANPASSHWEDYTTAVPDPANPKNVWSLGSYLLKNGYQGEWWAVATPVP